MKTFELGTQLLTAVALTAPATQTHPTDVAMLIRHIDTGTAVAAYLNVTDTNDIDIVTTITSSPVAIADLIQVDRPTTACEQVIGELRSQKFLANNWDGEGAHAPDFASIEEAVSFLNGLTEEQPVPEAMLHASGHAGLYWNEGDLYADIEFTGNGRLTYYIESGKDKHKGTVEYTKGGIPPVLATLLTL